MLATYNLVFLLFLASLFIAVQGGNIKTVVITVLENRSFDHIAGYFDYDPSINGLINKEFCNNVEVANPESKKFCATDKQTLVNNDNPGHLIDEISWQVFGKKVYSNSLEEPKMNGFVEQHVKEKKMSDYQLQKLMDCFSPATIPVLYNLAKEYALFDGWFSSVPASTFPNRNFIHMNTAEGIITNDKIKTVKGYTSKTMWEVFGENGKNFTNYWQEFPSFMFYRELRSKKHFKNLKTFKNFYKDAEEGTLPDISFTDHVYGLLPWKWGKNNDGHAPIHFSRTEMLLAEMYEALRKSPQWDNMLWLLITFDEHGGFPDHVAPPRCPAPDGKTGPDGFNFERLGVRVPTLAISPWVKKGRIVKEGTKPFPNSEFEHSSIAATLFKMFDIKETLTKRTEWASTFEFLFDELKEKRDDCPLQIVDSEILNPDVDEDEIDEIPSWDYKDAFSKSAEGIYKVKDITREAFVASYSYVLEIMKKMSKQMTWQEKKKFNNFK